MENWDDLKFVMAMMRHGTMSAAARYLDTNVATVSRRLDRLSTSLHTPLFEKRGQSFVPTQAAQRLGDLAEELDQKLRGEIATMHEGQLEIAVPLHLAAPPAVHSRYLLPHLSDLAEAIPQVHLTLTDKVYTQGLGEADIQIRVGCPEGGRLKARKFRNFAMRIYHRKDHQMNGEWIGLSNRYPDADLLRDVYPKADPNPRYRVDEMPMAYDAVRATGLPCILPNFMVNHDDDLIAADIPNNEIEGELWIAYHETRNGDATLRAVVDWLCRAVH
jgi:DNA-binding transcriptional LysR family regulator